MILRPFEEEYEKSSNIICLFIASHWKISKNVPAEKLLYIDVTQIENGKGTTNSIMAVQVVSGSPYLVKRTYKTQNLYDKFNNRGTKYVGK